MESHRALELADWRHQVAEIYRLIRNEENPQVAWQSWRRNRDLLFKTHPQSPIPPGDREGFSGLDYFDYDPAARVIAHLRSAEPESWEFEAGEGTLHLDRVADLSFSLYGELQQLGLYWFRSYGGGLFLSIRDATSGESTYGGCRYLLDTVKGADLGREGEGVVLDFNFLYQPSCAYNARWVCPLAPASNRIPLGVKAGERWRGSGVE